MGSVQTVPVIDVAPFLAGDPTGEAGSGPAKSVVPARPSASWCLPVTALRRICKPVFLRFAESFSIYLKRKSFATPTVPGTYFGYNPIGAERVAYSRGEKTPPDLKANFTFGRLDVDEP